MDLVFKEYDFNNKNCSDSVSDKELKMGHWCLRHFWNLGKFQCKSNFNRNEVILLMIENFETIKIGLYLPGGYIMDLEITFHVSCVTCYMSLFNLSQTVRARDLQFSHNILHVTCHLSVVTCLVSHVTCHVSRSPMSQYLFFCLFFTKCWSQFLQAL